MDFQRRAHPYTIPGDKEVAHKVTSDGHNSAGNEGEKPVSKLQRRHSDIKLYKEFCDFYARL